MGQVPGTVQLGAAETHYGQVPNLCGGETQFSECAITEESQCGAASHSVTSPMPVDDQ